MHELKFQITKSYNLKNLKELFRISLHIIIIFKSSAIHSDAIHSEAIHSEAIASKFKEN